MTTQPDTSRNGAPGAAPADARSTGGTAPSWGPPATPCPAQPAGPAYPAEPAAGAGDPARPFVHRVLRGRPEDPRWARPALLGLLLATAVLYLYGLSASGYANSFYSAAVQAGSQSWKAFFFGSLDSANAITVDKPPAALWPMALSVRVFGLELLGDPRPRGADGRRHGRRPVRRRAPPVRPGGGPDRGRGARPHPGRRADVPLQQPGRAARAAHDGHGLLRGPGAGGRPDEVAGAGRASPSASPSSPRRSRRS